MYLPFEGLGVIESENNFCVGWRYVSDVYPGQSEGQREAGRTEVPADDISDYILGVV